MVSSIFSSSDLVVVHFYADWAAQCGPMNDVLEELAKQTELKVSYMKSIKAQVVFQLGFANLEPILLGWKCKIIELQDFSLNEHFMLAFI